MNDTFATVIIPEASLQMLPEHLQPLFSSRYKNKPVVTPTLDAEGDPVLDADGMPMSTTTRDDTVYLVASGMFHSGELESLINEVSFERKVKFGPVEVALAEMEPYSE